MSQKYWSEWAQKIQQSPLKGFYLALLEGSGPLKLIVGELMLAGKVFISPASADKWIEAAETLEDDRQCKAFTAMLNEEKKQ